MAMLPLVWWLCCVVCAPGGPVQDAPAAAKSEDVGAKIEAWLAPLVEAGDLSGTLLVARGDEILFEASYGFANLELGVPNTNETRHCIASITKPMTAVIAGKLFETGRLTPTSTLAQWIPDFPRGDKITIEHLLSHRAGIAHRVTTPEQETVPRTAADMVELAKAADPIASPGGASIYSSGGYSVLARVLELAGGASYGELLERFVCKPAGLTRTVHTDGRTVLPGRADSYLPSLEGGSRNVALKDYSFLVGAGSVYSTARDLFRMQRAFVSGKLGAGVRSALMRSNGLRWNGQTGGFRAFADFDRETDVTVILVANRISGANDLVRSNVASIVAGESLDPASPPEIRPITVDRDALRAYEGVYELRRGSTLSARVGDDALYMDDWVLIPIGEGRFYSPQDYGTLEFERDEAGTLVALNWGGFRMPRVGSLDGA